MHINFRANQRMQPKLNVHMTCIEVLHCHTLEAASIFITINIVVAMVNRGVEINGCGCP